MKKLSVLALFCLLLTICVFGEEVRVGIISDFQPMRAGRQYLHWVEKAFRKMQELGGIDVLLVAGDLTDSNDAERYRCFLALYKECFAGNMPKAFIPVQGNHDTWAHDGSDDYYGKNPEKRKERREIFVKNLELESANCHKVVGGYSFIGVSLERGQSSAPADCAYMKAEIEKAIARAPSKPVFVVAHNHAANTVYGSEESSDRAIAETLKPYEQVVYISGHSHRPVEDERCIHQRDFTSINSGHICLAFMEPGKLSMPGRCDSFTMEYMTVNDSEILIRRFRLQDNSEIKGDNPWRLKLPLKKETFVYTDARKEARTAPAFPDGAKGEVVFEPKDQPFNCVKLTMDAARHPDFVHHYDIDVYRKTPEGTWVKEKKKLSFFSDFYRGLNAIKPRIGASIPLYASKREKESFDFMCGTEYKFEIWPVESFGKVGEKPLIVKFKTPDQKAAPEK